MDFKQQTFEFAARDEVSSIRYIGLADRLALTFKMEDPENLESSGVRILDHQVTRLRIVWGYPGTPGTPGTQPAWAPVIKILGTELSWPLIIWSFPDIGVPPVIIDGFSTNSPAIGGPAF